MSWKRLAVEVIILIILLQYWGLVAVNDFGDWLKTVQPYWCPDCGPLRYHNRPKIPWENLPPHIQMRLRQWYERTESV